MIIQLKNQNKLLPLFMGALFAVFFSSCGSSKNSPYSLAFQQLQKFEQAYYQGCNNLIQGEDEKALKYFLQALKINPQSSAVLYQISKLYTKNGDFRQGLYYGLQAVKESSEYNYWYNLNVAEIYEFSGQHDYSAQAYQFMFEQEPFRKELYLSAAKEYLFAEDLDNALKVGELMEENLGISEESTKIKAQVYLMKGDNKKVVEEFKALCSAFPAQEYYKVLLVTAYIRTGELNTAYDSLTKIQGTGAEVGETWLELADAFLFKEKYQEGYQCMSKAFAMPDVAIQNKKAVFRTYFLRINTSEEAKTEAYELLAILKQVHENEALVFVMYSDVENVLQNYEKAREYILQAIELDASEFDSWGKLIEIDIALRDERTLINDGLRALELFPNVANIYLTTAYAYSDLHMYDSALIMAEQGLDIVAILDQKIQLLTCQASVLSKLGRTSESDKAFDKALSYDKRNTLVLNNYAYALAERSDRLEFADSLITVALEFEDDNPYYLDTKGWIAFKMKKYDEAIDWTLKALKYDKESYEYYEHLAEIYLAKGDIAKAKEYISLAFEKGSNNTELKEKIYSNP